MINFSIIIPHKNSLESLFRLINSIKLKNNFEIIIVDDNSDVEYKEELLKISLIDNVNIYFNKSSKGAGKSRNIGIKHSKGKWLLFADADDYFTDSIEKILMRYVNAIEDMIYFATNSFDQYGNPSYRHERYLKLVKNYLSDNQNENALRYYFTPPWARIIKRKLIINNNILFDEVPASNDILFSLKAAYYAKKIGASENVLYIITLSKGSITNILNKEYFRSKFNIALKANKFLKSIGQNKYQQSVLYFLARAHIYGFDNLLYVIRKIIINRSNLFIGINKIFSYKKYLNERENKEYTIKKNEKR